MLFKMKRKTKNKLVGLVLAAGLTAGGTGCAGINDYDAAALLLNAAAMNNNQLNLEQRRAAALLANTAENLGDRQHQREIARTQESFFCVRI
jgi:hypothetical protein